MAERMSTTERMGKAVASSDLSHSPLHTTDADVLGAMGAAGIRYRQGRAILQMDLTMRAADIDEALAETKSIARNLVKKHGWARLSGKDLHSIARAALTYYTQPACPKCMGRGLIYAKHQRVGPCNACSATGKRTLDHRYAREVRAVLAAMEHLRGKAICGVNRQLGRPDHA